LILGVVEAVWHRKGGREYSVVFNFKKACNRHLGGVRSFLDLFIGYASTIKETADGSRRSASSEARRTAEV
jgi:hypothetical protein